MRTQLILTTAALGLAGAIGAQAQVYSVNAVGYVNVTVPTGKFALVANPLNTGGNTIKEVIPKAENGTIVYAYKRNADGTGTFLPSGWEFGGWSDETLPLPPGAGIFVFNGAPADQVFTFVGEVPQGTLTTELGVGLNLVSSKVPQAGLLEKVLGFPKADGDIVYLWKTAAQKYDPFGVEFGSWDPQEPAVAVGEGFFVGTTVKKNWTRNFSVNQ